MPKKNFKPIRHQKVYGTAKPIRLIFFFFFWFIIFIRTEFDYAYDYALIMLMRLIIFMIMPLNVKCKYFVILWFGKVILKNLCLLGRDVQLEVFILWKERNLKSGFPAYLEKIEQFVPIVIRQTVILVQDLNT